MYRCHVHFYLTGRQRNLFDLIKGIPSLENFIHYFSESDEPDKECAARADVILVHLQGLDVKHALQTLISSKRKEAKLILLADREQFPLFSDYLTEIDDIWTLPMSESEVSFRFLRWQQSYKLSKDFWQTSQFLESTINSVPNLVWYKTKTGIHEKVNDSFCKTVSKTKEQVQGRGHAYIWNVEQDDPACIESENMVMSLRKTCVSEEIIQTGEGKRLLTTYKSPLYDLDGTVMGTVGVAIDITQERAYEQEIIKKNHTLETLFTTLDCGIMCHSVDGSHIISINRAALKILGFESQEALQEAGFDLVAASVLDEDRDALRASILSLKKADDNVSVEYRVQHTDGEILHIMGNVKLIEEHGELFYQRFLLDCTAQKLQERRDRLEQEQRQAELVRALSIDYNLVCFFNLENGMGNILRLEDCEQHVLSSIFSGEITLNESIERYIQTCVHPDDRNMIRNALSLDQLRTDLLEKKTYYINYRTFCENTLKYFQIKLVLVGKDTKNYGAVLGFRSVDEETRRELEKKSLLEDALMQANRASKAKSTFLSNMSHDIRTPMNAIVGFTALAITHIEQKELVEEYLKKIMTSGNHLISLINDILDMSRIESGKLHLDEQLCSLPDILHGLRNIVQADVYAKQLDLYMDAVDILDEEIYCDRLRLNQVLLNLLGNSIKYTSAGGTVSIRVIEKTNAQAGYGTYEFHIKDTGIGMSKEFVEHIFEPFERERNSTISGIQGTGLGMAITKNIVDMMNGTINVKSEQGIGTEFILCLTFRLYSGTKEPLIIPELKDCRALVVDDDFNTCDSVTYMLQQIGMRAEWTLSGKEAVLRTRQSLMRNDNYCVYIIDWRLPDMNGVEVARSIRRETGENVPIIVLTAYDWADIEDEATEAGVTAFCSKPLFMSDLRRCLNSIVNADEIERNKAASELTAHYTGRILLAEDNELNQEIATAILNEAGFSVEIASNGEIAVDMLKNSEPDYYQLILMDVQMPVMNGYEATRAIRALKDCEQSSIPIIAMTANAFLEDKQEALSAGMNGHIAKPIDIKVLFQTLDKILS
ncbi:hybrid sensor histidine kinase/response regulator [Parablautia muri]|uniref:Stage 0 sporulation protein A homolog n=1 Tax=Parablautia muri TaxID=2320879 RepID=A0A9X5BG49_9FIRM|nr:response regulator [Parablautia muri]NBJ93466.1 response regulator [Parablautia muri]